MDLPRKCVSRTKQVVGQLFPEYILWEGFNSGYCFDFQFRVPINTHPKNCEQMALI